jgi:hypothetical protein
MPKQLIRKALVNGVEYEAGTLESSIEASPGELASLIGAGHLVDLDEVTTEAPDVITEAPSVTTAPPTPKRTRKR